MPRLLTPLLAALLLLCACAAPAIAAAPDPLDRGQYTVTTLDPYRAGTVNLQEPAAGGGPATGVAAAATLQIRGSLYYPADRPGPAPLIVLVHGNHGSCDTGSAPNCTAFKRNDRGYAYLGENLASWGYAVASVDQDQLMFYQDNPQGKGMHQRRLLIAATLDALYKANAEGLDDGPDANLGDQLLGKLDFSRVGLMGHSRGGDAVASFIDYNRTRPAPGRRYDLSGVISLAPVDYERRAPYGTAFMSILPYCDGDVSNLQGARLFERSQYVKPGDPFPRVQVSVHGTNHNWYNSVWSADGEDSNANDLACAITQPNNLRLSGGVSVAPPGGQPLPPLPPILDAGWRDGGTYTRLNRGSGDPALMGDQEKVGLALMASFFRRYVGGEEGFDEYMTGERDAAGLPELPESACPSQQISGPSGAGTDGTRLACEERIMTSYFAPPDERVDVIRPETEGALSVTALGTALTGSGFVSPYLPAGGVTPLPPATPGGYDWCNPEPTHFTPSQLGLTALPTATKPCPLPAAAALGGQTSSQVRENAPVNRSYGLQLALAWDRVQTGAVAKLAAKIPPSAQDVSGLEALALGAAVNFFDDRNPSRAGAAQWNPSLTTQDFTIALTDVDGVEGTVSTADQRYGNALHQTPGNTTPKVHVVLNQLRVPLADFEAEGVDLTSVRKVELRFGEIGKPGTGSIQLSDVRFQEAAGAPAPLADPGALIAATPRAAASPRLPDAIGLGGATKTRGCTDTAAPKLAITRVGSVLRGTASDRGCGGVRSVQVALAKQAKGGGCRFVTPAGKLSRRLPCSKPLALVAKGTRRWSLRLGSKVSAGSYRVVVRALDASGNEKAVRTRLTVS